jgi:hypothetical protein
VTHLSRVAVASFGDPIPYKCASIMAVRLSYSLPDAGAAHSPPPQTPVVLQDEDILSDVVPSNIVSRQVCSPTNARNFQRVKTLFTS